ncbi:MAG: hypothetical protein BGO43_14240 [Gammaproteobacteria bacterium 39-13]|nr:PTS sugar transporter subunit IIA [Gammaproteobacteria bacterium]OJV89844.1 MAG: hypothetical protein BGO43_14240 [Gammaproteobacteria bacterium 39-13]
MIELRDILTLDRIVFSATVQSKKKALELIADTISLSVPSLRTHDIFDGLVERERLGSTAIGHGVAIPHCRLNETDKALGCFILLKEGVDFDAEDHLKVDMLFSLIVPMDAQEVHLELLARIAKLLRHESNRSRFYEATSQEELYQRVINA